MFKLLEGVRVLEAAVLFNGDNVGMLLGDLGAEVIKIESVGRGDYLRDFLGQIVPHQSPAHLQVNRNKRSVALNLKDEEGRKAFFELLKTIDIFVDGFAGDACEKLGIGYEAQKAIKPDIIYLQYTGYGAAGPYAQIPTHGRQMNALVGGLPAKMNEDGFVERVFNTQYMGGTEMAPGGPMAGAPFAALAAVSALSQRNLTGKGAYIDVAGSDAVLMGSWPGASYTLNWDRITDFVGLYPRTAASGGNEGESARYQLYETKDGFHVLFCAIEPKFWNNFCKAADRSDLMVHDAKAPVDFAGGDDELRREIQSIFHTRTLDEWMKIAVDYDIAMGPSHRLEDVVEDSHIRFRGLVSEQVHPVAGPFTYITFPAMIDGEPYGKVAPAPGLGEHTDEVLGEIGLSADDIAELKRRGAAA